MLRDIQAPIGGKAGEQYSFKIERRCGASSAHIAHWLGRKGGSVASEIGRETIGRGRASQQVREAELLFQIAPPQMVQERVGLERPAGGEGQ